VPYIIIPTRVIMSLALPLVSTNQQKEGRKTTKMSSGFEKRMRLTEETN